MTEIKRVERCHGITLRRGADAKAGGAETQCKHTTVRGTLCWQHLKTDKSLQITNPVKRAPPYRLFTTGLIPKGGVICQLSGRQTSTKPAGYSVQIRKDPPTYIDASNTNTGEARYARETRLANSSLKLSKGKVNLVADRDIDVGEEITCKPEVKTKQQKVPRRRVRIPDYDPDYAEENKEQERIDDASRARARELARARAQRPVTQTMRNAKQKRSDQKFERNTITRLINMETMFNSLKVSEILQKRKPLGRKINIPRREDQSTLDWHNKLFKIEGEELKKLRVYWGSKDSGVLLVMLDKMGKKNRLSISDLEQNYY